MGTFNIFWFKLPFWSTCFFYNIVEYQKNISILVQNGYVLFCEIHRFEIYINYAPNNLIRLYRKFPKFAYYLSNFTFILYTMHNNKRFHSDFHYFLLFFTITFSKIFNYNSYTIHDLKKYHVKNLNDRFQYILGRREKYDMPTKNTSYIIDSTKS